MFYITHRCLSFSKPTIDLFQQIEIGNNKDGLLYYYQPKLLNFLNSNYIDFLNRKNEFFLMEEERKNKPKKTSFFLRLFGRNKNTQEQKVVFKNELTQSLFKFFQGKYDFDILLFDLLRNEILSYFKLNLNEEVQFLFIHNFIQSLRIISKEKDNDFNFEDHFHKPDKNINIPTDDYAYFLANLLIQLIEGESFNEDSFLNLIKDWLKIKQNNSFCIALVKREDLICSFEDFNENRIKEIFVIDSNLTLSTKQI